MLGNQIMDLTGRIVLIRVLDEKTMEPNNEASGTLAGVNVRAMWTSQTKMMPDGTLHAHGKWAIMGEGERASMEGMALGTMGPDGSMRFRGCGVLYSHTPKLAKLNSVAIVFEMDSDGERDFTMKGWEWK